jgi:hypothetical protein
MHFERWVFIQALVELCARKKPPVATDEVFRALDIDAAAYTAADKHYRNIIVSGLRDGDLGPAKRYAAELEVHRRELAAKQPSLGDVTRAEKLVAPPAPPLDGSADDTAMLPLHVPSVVLPFGSAAPLAPSHLTSRAGMASSSPSSPVVPGPNTASTVDCDETQAVDVSRLRQALPFLRTAGPDEDTAPAGKPVRPPK